MKELTGLSIERLGHRTLHAKHTGRCRGKQTAKTLAWIRPSQYAEVSRHFLLFVPGYLRCCRMHPPDQFFTGCAFPGAGLCILSAAQRHGHLHATPRLTTNMLYRELVGIVFAGDAGPFICLP